MMGSPILFLITILLLLAGSEGGRGQDALGCQTLDPQCFYSEEVRGLLLEHKQLGLEYDTSLYTLWSIVLG